MLAIVAAQFFPDREARSLAAAPFLQIPDSGYKYIRIGKASWYSRYDRGIKKYTANNEMFDDRDMTCALWGVEFNRKVKVTNLANGKSVVLRVNDRGPHERFVRQGRVIDLTRAAFEKLNSARKGLIDVSIEFL